MTSIPRIKTARLTLRPFRESDAAPLHHILGEEGVLRYFPNTRPPSIEGTQKLIQAQLRHWEENGYGWWAVEPRESVDLIGWNGLQYLPETAEVEVGYLLKKSYWGQGLAAEGGIEGLRYGFDELGLDEIIAIVHPDNFASQRVIEKLGMGFIDNTQYFGMEVYRYRIEAASFRRHL